MENLLQRLWDEYKFLVKQIDNTTGDADLSSEMQALSDSITDTPSMAELRAELKAAGVEM